MTGVAGIVPAQAFRDLDARLVEGSWSSDGPAERRLNLDVLRAFTGRPWVLVRSGDRSLDAVTWDRYGPGAAGNPVCAYPDFTRDIRETLGLIEGEDAEARTELRQREGDGLWRARVRVRATGLRISGQPGEAIVHAALSAALRFAAARREPPAGTREAQFVDGA